MMASWALLAQKLCVGNLELAKDRVRTFACAEGVRQELCGLLAEWLVAQGSDSTANGPGESDATTTALGQAPSGQPAATVQGVTLFHAAMLLNKDNETAARESKKRWRNKKSVRLPAPIGKSLEDAQEDIFDPSALVDFLEKVGDVKAQDKLKLVRALRTCARLGHLTSPNS